MQFVAENLFMESGTVVLFSKREAEARGLRVQDYPGLYNHINPQGSSLKVCFPLTKAQ